ncbi:MAG: hypothetical protein WCP28_07820 [Actinomycetes bacterium]
MTDAEPELAVGRIAAFHGRPIDGVEPLQNAVQIAIDSGVLDLGYEAAWLLGVCHSSAGHYGSALAVLGPLARDSSSWSPASPERPHFSALAATTIASVYRQLSMHTQAQPKDEWALNRSGDDPIATFDAWLGLAADFVGRGDSVRASQAWRRAQAEAATDEWRQQVRLGWVEAEIALMTDRPHDAVAASVRVVEVARRAEAPRHVAKSLLFAGVSALGVEPDQGMTWLTQAAQGAEALGALPLVWPSRAVLADTCRDPWQAKAHRSAAATAIEQILSGLPPALAAMWRTRPEVAANLDSSNPNE